MFRRCASARVQLVKAFVNYTVFLLAHACSTVVLDHMYNAEARVTYIYDQKITRLSYLNTENGLILQLIFLFQILPKFNFYRFSCC